VVQRRVGAPHLTGPGEGNEYTYTRRSSVWMYTTSLILPTPPPTNTPHSGTYFHHIHSTAFLYVNRPTETLNRFEFFIQLHISSRDGSIRWILNGDTHMLPEYKKNHTGFHITREHFFPFVDVHRPAPFVLQMTHARVRTRQEHPTRKKITWVHGRPHQPDHAHSEVRCPR
jgi:hypothetical protein